jgi:hypothetical protein
MSFKCVNRINILDSTLSEIHGKDFKTIAKRKVELLEMGTGAVPGKLTTWVSAQHRNNYDLRGNWLTKELRRSGGNSDRLSDRRKELYKQRQKLYNYEDFARLWDMCPQTCAITGTYINYGLGEAKALVNEFSIKVKGEPAISPSIERINPNLGYTMDNIEIISSFENIGRNQGVNVARLAKERATIQVLQNLGE